MCGRYAAGVDIDALVESLDVDLDATTGPDGSRPGPDFNVAPTKAAPVVVTRVPRDEPDGEPLRQLRLLTWGLVPGWAADTSGAARMINARAETLLDKPAYRKAATSRRCLVPAQGWYEWQRSPVATDAKGRPRKQPFFIRRADGDVLAMAGVYEFWRDRTLPDDHPQAWRVTYAVVTTAADEDLGRIHDRQPLVLERDQWGAWLDPALTDRDAVAGLLAFTDPGRFEAYPVSTAVNNHRNNGAGLLDPAAADTLVGVVDPRTGEVLA